MVIQLLLATDDPAGHEMTVSTRVEVNTADPRWPAWLVEAVTFQAQASARRLRDDLIAQQAIRSDGAAGDDGVDAHVVPLTAVVPAAQAGR
jgi:hypothetical protein